MKRSEVVVNLARSKWNDSDYEMIILIEAIPNVLIQIFLLWNVKLTALLMIMQKSKVSTFNLRNAEKWMDSFLKYQSFTITNLKFGSSASKCSV